MGYDKNLEKYDPIEKEKPYAERKEPSKLHLRKSECGEVVIKCENVYITINCDKENKCDY